MENEKKEKPVSKIDRRKPEYEAPKVVTYSGDDLLKELGPAQACSPFGGSVLGC